MLEPVLFLSHGSPTLPLEHHAATTMLRTLSERLQPPKAILVVSAHWETQAPAVTATTSPKTIHDFYGFPRELYRINYPASGCPDRAHRAYQLLRKQFSAVMEDPQRGLDHGAWVPLLLMYPEAQIPVFQVSIQPHSGPEGALELGKALAPLRHEGVLIIASGSLVHNLSLIEFGSAQTPEWAQTFEAWLDTQLQAGDFESLLDYRRQAPFGAKAHPSEEHLLPFFVAIGASLGDTPKTLFQGFFHGGLSMSAYAWGLAA